MPKLDPKSGNGWSEPQVDLSSHHLWAHDSLARPQKEPAEGHTYMWFLSWRVTFKDKGSSSRIHKWRFKQFINLHKQIKQRSRQMKARYEANKSNGLIIQARVTKRHFDMLIEIDKAKKTPKCQGKNQATRVWACKKQDNQESWLKMTPFERRRGEWWRALYLGMKHDVSRDSK